MRVTWQVEDGYVGGSRPHTTVIDDEDLEDLDEKERDERIDEFIEEDFRNKVSWVILSSED